MHNELSRNFLEMKLKCTRLSFLEFTFPVFFSPSPASQSLALPSQHLKMTEDNLVMAMTTCPGMQVPGMRCVCGGGLTKVVSVFWPSVQLPLPQFPLAPGLATLLLRSLARADSRPCFPLPPKATTIWLAYCLYCPCPEQIFKSHFTVWSISQNQCHSAG